MTRKDRPPQTLMQCQHQYSELTQVLAQLGFVWPGTLQRRMMTCGKPQCPCHQNPRARHGPYFCWTSKKNGKTVTRMLTREEAGILEPWINNRRTLNAILKRMMEVSKHALALTLRAKSKVR
jgi:hypothetical protein